MSRLSSALRRTRALPAAFATTVVALSLATPLALASDGSYSHHRHGAVPPPPAQPTSANQIQNIDQVKTAIKAYYGDTASTTPDPVDGTTTLHYASATGAYAHEMGRLVHRAKDYLNREARQHHFGHKKPAIVLDVDDTTLNTYDYEIYSNFVYNPTTNAAFVNAGVFPAVFHMPGLVKRAMHDGYTIFYLTGRPESQRDATVANLAKVGYSAPDADHLFLRNKTAPPSYLPCEPNCTTDQYKSLTRKHIQSLGYAIVGNFGDQYSDLSMDHERRAFKLPNPMYFLP